jgi:polyketide synthase PksN
MTDQERLLELTQSYLKSLVSTVVGTVGADFDALAPFGELGVDSFRVLKIIKALEADFGTLPKTLLFENFNISDLAQYFMSKHAQTLQLRFAKQLPSEVTPANADASSAKSRPSAVPVNADTRATDLPILLPEQQAFADPELQQTLREIFERYKNEGSVSRGTRNIAPNLFIGSRRKGFFNYSRSGKIILGYAYTGPTDYFAELAGELYEHCAERKLELNILAEHEIGQIGTISFSSTPFGALQRILNLRSFTLEGAAMRRLRYQVSRFEKAGSCRTVEYRCGSDPQVDRDIAAIIDQWCAARTMVNPLIHIVKEEILTGTLNPGHRIFLTHLDEVLQNVILISPLSSQQNGYLMDLEFYPRTMPLGGLEFAIVRMIETLVAEGCDVLSLGGTYGCKLETGANADAAVDKILDDLRMQNIFNDEGNLQFKNKFRPENKTIFLCRPLGMCTPDNVVDIIMSIADPARMQTSDAENQGLPKDAPAQPVHSEVSGTDSEAHGRSVKLSEAGFNPLNLDHQHVEFDLSTDSWAQLRLPAIDSHMQQLRAQLQQPADLQRSLQSIFPFAHFSLTTSGRAAEGVFYRAWSRKGGVAQNLLFPTTIFHQIDNGFTPRELPCPAVFQLRSQELYRGNLDLAALRAQLSEDPASIAMVCIELGDNASGGYPVAFEHLRQLKALLAQYSIALVMDATRVLENARFILEHEPEHAGQSVWDVTRAMLGFADAVVVSLAKDFCVKGGMIATNDAQLFRSLEHLILEEGCGLDGVDRRLVALSLQHRKYIELQTLRRKEAVLRIWAALKEQGAPIAEPAGGHCVLIDVKQLPQFKSFKHPVASFLAWMYLHTGIRAGAHSAGMSKGSALNDVVRLAIPVGLKPEQVNQIAVRLRALFAQAADVPELDQERAAAISNPQAKYQLVRFHNVSGRLEPPTRSSGARSSEHPVVASHSVSRDLETAKSAAPPPSARNAAAKDIAIIGMAGRYPRSRSLEQLWQNLTQGVDCIEDIPESRLEQRLHNRFTRRYRGGFIDGVDEFDARFFNISPPEAEILDPQERLFLEVACEALEDAGYYPETLAGPSGNAGERDIGVFVGAVWSMYQMLGVEEKIAGNNINPSSFFWSIANRVSYCMNLTGPSLTLDTACSASLTALHLACEAINTGECSAAIVGGVNLDLHQNKLDINAAGGSLSSDGVCRSFGKGANGYVSGEGVGALLVKPLQQAIADGDNIYGVIKSTAVSHSGRTSGYMIPCPQHRIYRSARHRHRARGLHRDCGPDSSLRTIRRAETAVCGGLDQDQHRTSRSGIRHRRRAEDPAADEAPETRALAAFARVERGYRLREFSFLRAADARGLGREGGRWSTGAAPCGYQCDWSWGNERSHHLGRVRICSGARAGADTACRANISIVGEDSGATPGGSRAAQRFPGQNGVAARVRHRAYPAARQKVIRLAPGSARTDPRGTDRETHRVPGWQRE